MYCPEFLTYFIPLGPFLCLSFNHIQTKADLVFINAHEFDFQLVQVQFYRSEERRVGKEC
jgi:hypothetical protein